MPQLDFAIWDPLSYTESLTLPTHELYERHLNLAQEVEQMGFHSYFTIEHQNADVGVLTGPTVWLTAIARATSVIRMGAMIWQLPFHHPMRLAQEVAMLDQLSHGRVEFGTGIGTHEHEFIRWGMEFMERGGRSMEATEIIKKAWTQQTVDHEGEFWTFNEALPQPHPYQKPHPPIWVGAHGKAALDFAAKGNYHVAQNNDIDSLITQKFQYYRQVWEESKHSGPRPRVFLMRPIHVAETDAKAREEAEPFLITGRAAVGGGRVSQTRIGWGSNPRGQGIFSEREDNKLRGESYKMAAQSWDYTIENGLAIVGSPETVVRKIEENRQLMRYDIFCGSHGLGEMPWEMQMKSLRLMGREVLPAFQRVERPAAVAV
ncbi:MAG: LLM class flavin-dependent oxidoreductase [Dehalococcoidia bacterium]|nr:LLM class flavin-dependent oxidoreductase [Dehalococcoidia bacterium]